MNQLPSQRAWYERAVFYEIFVRSFYDSNGDGWGDIAGVTAKLDYLKALGVDCLWLLPFFASPLRDGGYDVSDYYTVHPRYGANDDLRELLEQAHARGMRVIGDLVLNHTSDEHPWFVEARRPGSAKRDWYVWSETGTEYADARVIFPDFETSNWQWDEVAGAYYWHRFRRFQPDLNYDNPEVQAEMLAVTRYWLELGLDGFRLDAVPHLYQREGTSCENLPETHAFLKRLRAEVERVKPGAVLLAETNQKPTELVKYFGDGDECQMAFNFPVMGDIFESVMLGRYAGLAATLRETPELPAGCAWGVFLRNHDELSPRHIGAERLAAFMAAYAPDPRARFKAGLRRRLAPMLGHDRAKLELVHGLLLSLPGSPVLYYGDEIGMGDDLELGDRDPVRTPMQWDRGALGGFSEADAADVPLAPVEAGLGGWQAANVAAQEGDSESLLRWVRRAVHLRRLSPALREGSMRLVETGNEHVMAYVREAAGESVLVVVNFAASSQTVDLALEAYRGMEPFDLFGRRKLAPGVDQPRVTLPGYGYTWVQLTPVRVKQREARLIY